MRILYKNHIGAATLTASSFKTNREVSLLQNPHLTRSFSFGACVGVLLLDFGEEKKIKAVCLGGTNLVQGDTILLEGNSEDSWDSPPYSHSITWYQNHPILFLDAAFQYWRVSIVSQVEEVEIGHLFFGEYLQLPGINPNLEFEYNRSDKLTLNSAFNAYGDKGTKTFAANFSFPFIKENSETILGKDVASRQEVIDMWDEVGSVIPVYLCIWEEDLFVQPAIYGVLQQGGVTMKRDIKSHSYSCEISFQETK